MYIESKLRRSKCLLVRFSYIHFTRLSETTSGKDTNPVGSLYIPWAILLQSLFYRKKRLQNPIVFPTHILYDVVKID